MRTAFYMTTDSSSMNVGLNINQECVCVLLRIEAQLK
jgi:hypothetical protein